MKTEYSLTAIGKIVQQKGSFTAEIAQNFREGLKGLEEFSHVQVLWLFDQAPWNGKTMTYPGPYKKIDHDLGIYATRGPFRPNSLALTCSRILKVDAANGIIVFDWIDAEDGSPIVDLKPYHPSSDIVKDFKMPSWCSHWPKSREESGTFDWAAEYNF